MNTSRQRKREYTSEEKRNYAQYMRARDKKLRAQKLCIKCGLEEVDRFVCCKLCRLLSRMHYLRRELKNTERKINELRANYQVSKAS